MISADTSYPRGFSLPLLLSPVLFLVSDYFVQQVAIDPRLLNLGVGIGHRHRRVEALKRDGSRPPRARRDGSSPLVVKVQARHAPASRIIRYVRFLMYISFSSLPSLSLSSFLILLFSSFLPVLGVFRYGGDKCRGCQGRQGGHPKQKPRGTSALSYLNEKYPDWNLRLTWSNGPGGNGHYLM